LQSLLLIGLPLDTDKYLEVLSYKIKIVLMRKAIPGVFLLELKKPLSQNPE